MPTHVPLLITTPPLNPPIPVKPAHKKGAERVGSVSYQSTPRHLRVHDQRLSTRGPSVPRARRVRSCVKTPRRPSFARQFRQLGGPVHLCLSARGPNFGALPLGWGMGRGRASAVGAAGFWGGWGGCWGAASAGDVAIAPFLLIPSSIQGEEAHSHQGHRGNHQVQTLQTSVQASYTIPNQLHPITPLPVPIYPIPSQHPIPSTYSTTNLPSPVNV